jgi:hypothetical protein
VRRVFFALKIGAMMEPQPGSPIRQERIGGARSAARRAEGRDARAKSCPLQPLPHPEQSLKVADQVRKIAWRLLSHILVPRGTCTSLCIAILRRLRRWNRIINPPFCPEPNPAPVATFRFNYCRCMPSWGTV